MDTEEFLTEPRSTLPNLAAVPAAKHRPPRHSHAEVNRTALLAHKNMASVDIVALSAPAGFGKTNLAIQWAAQSPRPPVWITLDKSDSDPIVLISTILAALDHGAGPVQFPLIPMDAKEPALSRLVRPAFLTAIEAVGKPITLVVDDVHVLTNPVVLDLLAAVVESVPDGSQVAIVGREVKDLPLDRWRGQGRLHELHAPELAFSRSETSEALLAYGRRHLDEETVDRVQASTQGWPVLVYIATGDEQQEVVEASSVGGYLDTQVLGEFPQRLQEFLLDICVVEAVSPSLVEALTQDEQGPQQLAEICDRTLLATRTEGDWLRLHPMFREHLLASRQRNQPARVRELNERAARWYLDQGFVDLAVGHAIASHSQQVIGDIVWPAGRIAMLQGRSSSVKRWLDQIPQEQILSSSPLSLTGAFLGMGSNDFGSVLHYAQAALLSMPEGWQEDLAASSSAPHLAILLATNGHEGPKRSAELAAAAFEAVAIDDPLRPLARLIEGLNLMLACDHQGFSHANEAAELAELIQAPTTRVEALALLSLERISNGDQTRGCDLAEQAEAVWKLAGAPDLASTHAVMTLSAAALRTIRAPDDSLDEKLERLCRIRDEAAPVLPWYSALSAAVLAFAWARTGRINRAEKVLRHLAADDPWRDSPLVRNWLTLAKKEISRAIPLSQLSAAEFRVWDYVLGRLTLSEIADSLCLSRETVKTHTGSIYRKLGVTSRREAQDLADEWGVGQGEYA